MAWMRMMGAESVAYHRATVLERGDDYPGRALAYYASRGETPLVWGGSGTLALGLDGPVVPQGYEAIFGPGGARHPATGERLVAARRPGMELVISAHKSVAELGVIGRAEHLHLIMDAERDATLGYLDQVTRETGGRRGRSATATSTGGLVYAHTRHATSRAGDPCPHDHVLLANLVEMRDRRGLEGGGHRLVAGTLARGDHGRPGRRGPGGGGVGLWDRGRLGAVGAAAALADRRSPRRRDGGAFEAGGRDRRRMPAAGRQLVSGPGGGGQDHPPGQTAQCRGGVGGPVARRVGVRRLVGRAAGGVDRHRGRNIGPPPKLSLKTVRRMLGDVLSAEGELARRKVFSRRHLLVELAPHLFGQDPHTLDLLVDRALQDPEAIPLVGVVGAREQPHALATVLATEQAIANGIHRQLERRDAPTAPPAAVDQAILVAETTIGAALSPEQRRGGRGYLQFGAGRRADRGRGRRREDHPAGRGRRRLRDSRLPGDWHGYLRPGRPHPQHRSSGWGSRGRWPACCGGSITTSSSWMTAAW